MRIICYKLDENNAGIIECLHAGKIKELLGTKMAECSETCQKIKLMMNTTAAMQFLKLGELKSVFQKSVLFLLNVLINLNCGHHY